MAELASVVRFAHRGEDCLRTGPGTPAGRYLRQFWPPVYHSIDLAPGRAVTIRFMSDEFTLYRGDSGQAHLVDAVCPHRGTRLSSGWVEGDALRCFYHGWKFASDGRCIEQPAEENAFCQKVTLRSRPVREYLGLVFAFLGEGAPPDIAIFKGIGLGRALDAEESGWGVTYGFTRPDGQRRVQQFGMPNIFYLTALPTDPEIGWQESMFWWVPIDDTNHMQFSVHRVPARGEAAARLHARRQARRAEIEIPHQVLARDVLEGRASMRDIDKKKVDLVRLQHDVAQVGQGLIAEREGERLGRPDVGVIAIRRLWARELTAFLEGRPTQKWRRDSSIVPRAWGLSGNPAQIGGEGTVSTKLADVIDVRPHVEIAVQLKALHATLK